MWRNITARESASLGPSQRKIKVGAKALDELKAAYKQTEEAESWPVEWRGQSREKEWVKRQIVGIYKQVESQKKLLGKIDTGVKRLDGQTLKIQDARAQAQEQLAEVKTSREMLKIQRLSDDLTDQLIAMKSTLQVTLGAATDADGIVSLDQLAAEAEPVFDDDEFSKIMGE